MDMKKLHNSRGVMLITVLMLVVFLVMFASATLVLTLSQKQHYVRFYHGEAAYKAAEAGLNYAMSRLSKVPVWVGVDPAVAGDNTYSDNVAGLTTHERRLGSVGWVEGQILTNLSGTTSRSSSYFDMYFAQPAPGTTGDFFGINKDAGLIPADIFLCNNNSIATGAFARVNLERFSGTEPNRTIPPHSIFVSVRGVSGGVIKVLEVCMRPAPYNMDSCVMGSGNVKLHLTSLDSDDKIAINDAPNNKPSYIRSIGDMSVGFDSVLVNPLPPDNTLDYLAVDGQSEGQFSGALDWQSKPTNNLDSFKYLEGDEAALLNSKVPELSINKIIPTGMSFQEIDAGVYVIRLTDEAVPELQVRHYKINPVVDRTDPNNPTYEVTGSFTDVTTQFKLNWINTGKMAWDPETRKLTLKSSFKTKQIVEGGQPLNSIFFMPEREERDRIIMQIGPDAVPGAADAPVYFINNNQNGDVFVDGQLSGTGTIIARGNIDMEPESQMTANELNGISIYAGGDVNVHQIDTVPFLETEPGNPTSPKSQAAKKSNDYQSVIKNIDKKIKSTPEGEITEISTSPPATKPPEKAKLVELGIIQSSDSHYYVRKSDSIAGPEYNVEYPLGSGNLVTVINRGYIDELITNKGTEDLIGTDEFGRPITIRDSVFRGLLYACRNFKVHSPDRKFMMEGSIYASGVDVESGDRLDPSSDGNIQITADSLSFKYNSKFSYMLTALGNVSYEVIYWMSY